MLWGLIPGERTALSTGHSTMQAGNRPLGDPACTTAVHHLSLAIISVFPSKYHTPPSRPLQVCPLSCTFGTCRMSAGKHSGVSLTMEPAEVGFQAGRCEHGRTRICILHDRCIENCKHSRIDRARPAGPKRGCACVSNIVSDFWC